MNEKKESKIKQFFSKFKKVKGIEIAIVFILISVMLLIAFSSFKSTKDETTLKQTTDFESYCNNLESKLNKVLSQIEGAGDVSSMITFETDFVQKIAYNQEESSTSGNNGSTTTENQKTNQSVVYITENGQQKPLVLYTENPKISGVVVVCKGAKNINVKLDIIRAVSALLNIDASSIEVFCGK